MITLNENRHTPVKIFNFNTQILNKFHASSVKTQLTNKRKIGLLVSLRAPKHFKVGRQQFNTFNHLIRTTFFINSTSHLINYNDSNKYITNTSKAIVKNLPSTSLASFTSIKITYQINYKFKII